MLKHILVALDGSQRAEKALPLAADLARASGGSLLLIQVISPPSDYAGDLSQAPLLSQQTIDTALAQATSDLEMTAKEADLAGIAIQTEVLCGAPAEQLLDVAESRGVDLVMLCSRGRTGLKRWALGSLADKLSHQCPVPVLVLHEDELDTLLPRADAPQSLCALVALDGSSVAEAALLPAAQLVTALAGPAKGALHLVQVVKGSPRTGEEGLGSEFHAEAMQQANAYLAEVAEHLSQRLPDLAFSITWSVVFGTDTAERLLQVAEQPEGITAAEAPGGYNLMVMATHGREGFERWRMGSVTERMLHSTKLPMLLVRPSQKAGGIDAARIAQG